MKWLYRCKVLRNLTFFSICFAMKMLTLIEDTSLGIDGSVQIF